MADTKGRILFLERYMLEHTDDEHSITTDDLIRIYEENGYTYMDGICTNSFDGTLTGEARLCFYDKDEKLVGYGVIHTAEGSLTLGVGANRIYAEILSEVNVQQLDCRIEQTAPFNPA